MRSLVQEETFEWISRLEELAVQNNVKLRLLDAIRDCKRAMEPELSEVQWRQKCMEIDELLEQMEKQLIPQPLKSDLETDVALRVSEILARCRRTNELLLSEYSNGAGTYVQEAEGSMLELSNVKANYDEVTNLERLLGAFRNIGQKLKMQLDEQSEKCVKSIDRNYMDAFDRMRGLFSGTGFDQTAKQKFYKTFYENMDIYAKEAQEYARSIDKGESKISELAEKIRSPLEKLLSRLGRKAHLLKWLPAILLALVLGAYLLSNYIITAKTQMQETEQTVDGKPIESPEGVLDSIASFDVNKVLPGDRNKEEPLKWAEIAVKLVFFFMIRLPIILLAILLYYLYCKGVNKRHRVWVCNQAGTLLATSIEEFRRENTLDFAAKESYQQIYGHMRNQYEGLLSELLPDLIQEDNGDKKEEMFKMLCAEWKNIKRKAVEN